MIKRFVLASAMVVLVLPSRARQADVDPHVQDIISRMTLEEKAGQMTQLTLQAVSSQAAGPGQAHILNEDALREALVENHVGSLLNVYDMAFTAEYWRELITIVQDIATQETRLGIPIVYGIDAIHGNNYLTEATLFPQQIGLAATFNPDLIRQGAAVTAAETRAVGLTWNFAPVLDVGRHPLWSRFFETFGEDPYLTTVLGRASIQGQQGTSLDSPVSVAATTKHFLGYSMPLTGKDRTTAWIPERQLREIFLPPFQGAFDAGAATLMINSGDLNGEPVHASHDMLTQLLRHELGFEGVAVSDWEDIGKLVSHHRVAVDYKDAVRQVVLAGMDMAMTPYDVQFADLLVELVREGAVPESRLDQSVARILKLKFDLGLFENPYPPSDAREIGSVENHALSLEAARQSLTLLENNGVLPLEADARMLLVGPGADRQASLHGSWSYTWQGTNEDAYPDQLETVLDAFSRRFDNMSFAPGADWFANDNLDQMAAMADEADVIVVALAERPSVEQPGSIEDLHLPGAQLSLVRRMAEAGKPVVVVGFFNRPRLLNQVVDHADAILMAWYPGPHGGEAVADVLTGAFNPSGHLPFTYPRFNHSLVPYDHNQAARADTMFGAAGPNPQWAFGHGLSYTEFEYSDLSLSAQEIDESQQLTVSVTVTNTGPVGGADVVQLYVSDRVATIAPSVKRLRDFRRIHLQPGASKTVTFTLDRTDLAFVGKHNTWTVEPGEFQITIEDQSASFDLR